MRFLKLIILSIFILIACLASGCVEEEPVTETTTDSGIPVENYPNSQNENEYNTTLKKTQTLDLDNGYSLKVLEINKKEEYIHLSFRKDDQEYSTQTIVNGQTYNVKDCNNKNVVYLIRVDKIYDNSFLVELTYQVRPEILLDVVPLEESQQSKVEIKIDKKSITRYYNWKYDNTEFNIICQYNIDAYNSYSQRSRYRDYVHFVNDPYDDELISQITSQIVDLAGQTGYESEVIPYITMAFVQSLPYISDSASSGYDEYTRFPFETLYNGGGDCEDSSILIASLLNDMGYDVALIQLPGHMAVGVRGGQGITGNYYEYGEVKYYYLETTDSGWDIGEIPDDYKDADALVMPIYNSYPELGIDFTGSSKGDSYYTYINLDVKLENVGSEKAKDVLIYTSLETTQENMVWDELKSDVIASLDVDGEVTYTVSNLKAPAGEKYRISITTWGSNANPVSAYSDWVIA